MTGWLLSPFRSTNVSVPVGLLLGSICPSAAETLIGDDEGAQIAVSPYDSPTKVRAGRGVRVAVAVLVAVTVGVSVGTGVSVGAFVGSGVSVGTGVSVGAFVGSGVSVDVAEAVGVAVSVGVTVGVLVRGQKCLFGRMQSPPGVAVGLRAAETSVVPPPSTYNANITAPSAIHTTIANHVCRI